MTYRCAVLTAPGSPSQANQLAKGADRRILIRIPENRIILFPEGEQSEGSAEPGWLGDFIHKEDADEEDAAEKHTPGESSEGLWLRENQVPASMSLRHEPCGSKRK